MKNTALKQGELGAEIEINVSLHFHLAAYCSTSHMAKICCSFYRIFVTSLSNKPKEIQHIIPSGVGVIIDAWFFLCETLITHVQAHQHLFHNTVLLQAFINQLQSLNVTGI